MASELVLIFRLQQSKPNEVKHAVEAALRAGYRHIDAASVYGNEAEVGQGIKASGVDRSEIFVGLLRFDAVSKY